MLNMHKTLKIVEHDVNKNNKKGTKFANLIKKMSKIYQPLH